MRMWERQHADGSSATITEPEAGTFAVVCRPPMPPGGHLASLVAAQAAADTFFRDQQHHQCSAECGAWTEAVVVDPEKAQELQDGLIRRTVGEHAGHPDFRIWTFAGGGVRWQCSCDKASGLPS